ncbi:MAG: hypothetical protein QXD03_03850 [Candidatus Anstonellales archaeon]
MSNVVNLDNIISKCIHTPRVDGYPLYARVDGSLEEGMSVDRGEKWLKACNHTYNSPTNIRRVFITGRRVVIEYYCSRVIEGKPDSTGRWNFKQLEVDLRELIYNHFRGVEEVRFKGTGLSSLYKPWVTSNIEEVYFDWTLLFSEVYMNSGLGCNELLQAYLSNKARGLYKGDIATNMFTLATFKDIQDLRNRYPRLRVVGLISELDSILSMGFSKGKNIKDIIGEETLWYKDSINMELIKQSNSLIVINELKDVGKVNKKFIVRDGIYKYDRDILKNFVNLYTSKIDEYLYKPVEEVKTDVIERLEKSDMEVYLDEIEASRGAGDVRNILLLALDGLSNQEVELFFKSMSSEGEVKYRKLIGK